MNKTPLQIYLERENRNQEEYDQGDYERLARKFKDAQPPTPKLKWTLNHVLCAIWVFIWVACSIWVGYGNPKEDFVYAMFWGGVISFMIVSTLAGCFARIWLAYHTPEIVENIYRGLCSRK